MGRYSSQDCSSDSDYEVENLDSYAMESCGLEDVRAGLAYFGRNFLTRRDHDTKGWGLYDFYVGGNYSMDSSGGHNMAAL